MSVEDLVARHQPTLENALRAIRTREYFSAYPESPSPRVYGETAADGGKAAYEAWLGQDFPLDTPGAEGRVATERSPFGPQLGVRYPRVTAAGLDPLFAAVAEAMPAWRDAGPAVRAAVCLEI
ncbi:MAG TPA: hypothetical protein VIQ02_00690, partial [Jiangellaceae bacterium]